MKQKLQYWLLILIYGAVLWFGTVAKAEASSQLSQSDTNHILGRLSFGTTSEQLKKVQTEGIEAYIQSQLEPETIPESPVLEQYLAQFDATYQEPLKLHQKFIASGKRLRNAKQASNEKLEKLQKDVINIRRKARDRVTQIHLTRAIYSSRQLQEVMVDFWFNHFNVYANKSFVTFWLEDYEELIRQNALGNFRDLLEVTATNPAMLMYLDNEFNTDPNSPLAKNRYKGLNENYARELMELHTLGVDGGYSQADIITLARIFTGWTVDYESDDSQNGFVFNDKRHDREEKVFLGQKITASGIEEGRQALDILASHPATAHFISYKLAQYFVADRPPASLVDSLFQKFQESQGNIKVVMDSLIHSPEFNDPQYSKKFKTPYQYLISLVRYGEIEQPNLRRLQGMLSQLSMPVYMCVPPTGYKNTADAWLNPEAMLQRIAYATAIAGKTLNPESSIEYEQLANNMGELSAQTQQVITDSPKLRTALILGSPEAMYR
jgi:uncharacterized protein (DUF1800 family)